MLFSSVGSWTPLRVIRFPPWASLFVLLAWACPWEAWDRELLQGPAPDGVWGWGWGEGTEAQGALCFIQGVTKPTGPIVFKASPSNSSPTKMIFWVPSAPLLCLQWLSTWMRKRGTNIYFGPLETPTRSSKFSSSVINSRVPSGSINYSFFCSPLLLFLCVFWQLFYSALF